MVSCRLNTETKQELDRIQDYLETKGHYWTDNDIISNGVQLLIDKYHIPDRNKNLTEQDLNLRIKLLKKKGIEYSSMVVGRND